MIILQVSPENAPGTGVGGVVNALEAEWRALGHDVRWFGPAQAGCSWLSAPRAGLRGRLVHAVGVVWFSTVGTWRARKAVRQLPPGSISICHNDALAGDIYVNHGLLGEAMRARGNYVWRMVRNPLHLFTAARDQYRFRRKVHRIVVSLSRLDRDSLAEGVGMPPEQLRIIPNGVHLEGFSPATAQERMTARQSFGVPEDARVVIFVGHEFSRKGLPIVLHALHELSDHYLLVVGGTEAQVAAQRAVVPIEVAERTRWLGRLQDPRAALAAADVLALPSAYEANPLVVLEALAAGLQVVATPVGSVPGLLRDDEVARIVGRSSAQVEAALRALSEVDLARETIAERARARASGSDWSAIAHRYLDLFDDVLAARGELIR